MSGTAKCSMSGGRARFAGALGTSACAFIFLIAARAVLAERPGSGLYLWVLEKNVNARAFYDARGGTCVEARAVLPPGGDQARLNGKPIGLRYAWSDPSALLTGRP